LHWRYIETSSSVLPLISVIEELPRALPELAKLMDLSLLCPSLKSKPQRVIALSPFDSVASVNLVLSRLPILPPQQTWTMRKLRGSPLLILLPLLAFA
jgi:hypothetical protein